MIVAEYVKNFEGIEINVARTLHGGNRHGYRTISH